MNPDHIHLQIDKDRITYSGPQTDYSIAELTALYREHNRQQRIDKAAQGLSTFIPWLLGLLVIAIAVLYVPIALLQSPSQSTQLRR